MKTPSRNNRALWILAATASAAVSRSAPASAAPQTTSASTIQVNVNSATGAYEIVDSSANWKFSGSIGTVLSHVETTSATDKLGAYTDTKFEWPSADGPLFGSIRTYAARHAVLMSVTTPKALSHGTPAFPAFTTLPASLHTMSFNDTVFSPHVFRVESTSTPVLLFDDKGDRTAVISPASDFFVSRMFGDGSTGLSSGLNTALSSVPAGFTHSTLMVFGKGIRNTFNDWGHTFDDYVGRKRPGDDADLLLKYFGYWTDNGAFYYYNYDKTKGYAGTMDAIVDHYNDAGIPLRYLQLDSWWYQKTRVGPNGKEGGPKAKDLPVGTWNAYGGTLEYRASPDLFPDGLASFHKKLDVPLVVHGRWIDPSSPYHASYKISGFAPVDPRWWRETATYLNNSGVICYEQDWLNEIYTHSPEMHSTLEAGPAFADNMALAAKASDQTLQYCMATPRYFLNGARYDNLTTIRVSGDRFERNKWNAFLYTSEFASAVGIWPWVDVFKSTEVGNFLLATLSAGPVGIGDAIGTESKENIFHAVRSDGRIVKPDAPIVPADETVLADARGEHKPAIGWTYTDHGAMRTAYVVAFARKGDQPEDFAAYVPASTGVAARTAYIYDYFAKVGHVVNTTDVFRIPLSNAAPNISYDIVAPIGVSGIALLGDLDNYASAGKQRVPEVTDTKGGATLTVAIAQSEKSVTITGYAPVAPTAQATLGGVSPVTYDAATHRFSFTVDPGEESRLRPLQGDNVFLATVVLTPGKA